MGSRRLSSLSRGGTTRRSMPKKAQSERQFDINPPPLIDADSPKSTNSKSRRRMSHTTSATKNTRRLPSSYRSKSLRNVKALDELSCSRHSTNTNNWRKIKKRDNTDVPDRLRIALGRSVSASPSGKIRELAMSMIFDDEDLPSSSSEFDNGKSSSAILSTPREEEKAICHLLANPAKIPLNIRW